jgi:L-aminopeptidase/D-esterase-like protein
MAHDGMARAITPVHTMYDGDTIFAVSVVTDPAQQNQGTPDITVLGTAAAKAFESAVMEAVKTADSLHGYPSVRRWNEAP